MSETTLEQRSVLTFRTGTKVCFIVAAVLACLAVYFYFVPVQLPTETGGAFGCGSASRPPSDKFQSSVCLESTTIYAFRAYAAAAMAVLVAGLGYLFFGADRHLETRAVPAGGDADASTPASERPATKD